MAKRYRSAKSGELVTAKYAKKHKATTVSEKKEKIRARGYMSALALDCKHTHMTFWKYKEDAPNVRLKAVKIVEA